MRFQCLFDQDVEDPMNACLSANQYMFFPPMNHRFDVLAGDKDIIVVIYA